MRQFIRGLSRWTEFAIVILGAFGYFIVTSVFELGGPTSGPHISEAHLWFLLIYEPIVFTVLAFFLRARGWSFARIGLRPTIRETLLGLGLAVVAYVTITAIWMILASPAFHSLQSPGGNNIVASNIPIHVIIAVSTINPIFEEVFVSGYVISSLKRRFSPWTAINVSVAIRLLYHLYQGAWGVVTIIPIGLIFAFWYARSGRLWPLIVAHAALDLVGLLLSTG